MSVVVLATVSEVVHRVNRQRTTALGAIKCDEPSLTAAATPTHVKIALINDAKSGIILHLVESAILSKNKQKLNIRTEDI